jgi:hypothetical protein
MKKQIPEIGGCYEKPDGDIAIVTGLVLDEEGDFCVEYETDEETCVIGLHEWLGVDRTQDFPFPDRFVLVDQVCCEHYSPEKCGCTCEEKGKEPAKEAKLRVLSRARDFNKQLGENEPIKVEEKESDE